MVSSALDRRITLVTAVAANFSQFGARVVISPFVLVIARTFGRTKGDIGLVLTLMWATFAVFQFPSGVFADRYGERRIILLSLGLTAIGSGLVGLSPTYTTFILAALTLGAGAGLYFAVGTALLSRVFKGASLPFGIHSAGVPIAGLIFPLLATAIALRFDWRAGILSGSAITLVVFGITYIGLSPKPPTDPESNIRERLHPRSAIGLLSNPGVLFTIGLSAIGMYVFQAFVSFFPSFLQEYHDLSGATASSLFAGVFVLLTIFMPVAGYVADQIGTDRGLVGVFFFAISGFMLVLVDSWPALLLGVVVLGIGLTWHGVLQARFMELFKPGEKGTGFGLSRTVYVLLGSVGNVTTGMLAENLSWVAAYGLVITLLVCALGSVIIHRSIRVGI